MYRIFIYVIIAFSLGCNGPLKVVEPPQCNLSKLFEENKFSEVINCSRDTVRNDDKNIEAMEYLAMSYYLLQDYDSSLYILNRLIEICPCPGIGNNQFEYSNYLNKRGLIFGRKGLVEEAFADFQLAELNSINSEDRSETYISKALVIQQNSGLELIIPFLDSALIYNPKNDFALFTRANAYYSLHNYNYALRDVKEAISINNSYDKYYSMLGDLLYYNMEFDDAISAYKEAITLNSQEPIYYLNIAFIENRMGRLYESCDYYKKYIAKKGNPDSFFEELCSMLN